MPEQGALQHPAPLRFKADWGGANLTRAAGWLAQWVYEHTSGNRLSVIHTGRGMGDNLPEGRGPFAGRPVPGLVAIAALPHRDAMVPVVRSHLGLQTLSDVAGYPGPLRVSLGLDDPDGFIGFGGNAVLEAGGVDLAAIVACGGTVTRHEQPFDAVHDLREGRADLPADYSPLRYPIDYRSARATALDLHPAAALEYQEADPAPTQVA